MIDVLGFPPTTNILELWRDEQRRAAERPARLGRIARFVSLGLFLGWIADVVAAIAPDPGVSSFAFGIASPLIAVVVVLAHLVAKRLLVQAQDSRRRTDELFSLVRTGDVQELLDAAAADPVVAQYLRMVGRQRRPLYRIELSALTRWTVEAPLLRVAASEPCVQRLRFTENRIAEHQQPQ